MKTRIAVVSVSMGDIKFANSDLDRLVVVGNNGDHCSSSSLAIKLINDEVSSVLRRGEETECRYKATSIAGYIRVQLTLILYQDCEGVDWGD